jgi:hypothetical protein
MQAHDLFQRLARIRPKIFALGQSLFLVAACPEWSCLAGSGVIYVLRHLRIPLASGNSYSRRAAD